MSDKKQLISKDFNNSAFPELKDQLLEFLMNTLIEIKNFRL